MYLLNPITLCQILLNQFRYAGKLIIIGILFLIPIATLFYYFQQEVTTGYQFAKAESDGITYLQPMSKLIHGLSDEYRLAELSRVKPTDKQRFVDSAQEINDDIAGVDKVNSLYGTSLKLNNVWSSAKTSIQNRSINEVTDGVPNRAAFEKLASDDLAARNAIMGVTNTLNTTSNMILDPEMDSYFAIDAATVQSVQLGLAVIQLYGASMDCVVKRSVSKDDYAQLVSQTNAVNGLIGNLQSDVSQVAASNPAEGAKISELATKGL